MGLCTVRRDCCQDSQKQQVSVCSLLLLEIHCQPPLHSAMSFSDVAQGGKGEEACPQTELESISLPVFLQNQQCLKSAH